MTAVETGSWSVTTTIHFVRHAVHDLVDRVLVGRDPGVGLSGAGIRQAQALGTHFAARSIARVQASPQLRARQTAQPIADLHGLRLEVVPEVDELDMGAWTGRSFQELERDPQWQLWNSQRNEARPPHGETMRELQRRVLRHLHHVGDAYRGEEVVIVSHAEPIRAAVLHFLALSPDDFLSVQIAPASVTTIVLRERSGEVVRNNDCIEDFVAA
jgi:probable phosphoglycerate mutase